MRKYRKNYDSIALSQGVYDNMSGSAGIPGVADFARIAPNAARCPVDRTIPDNMKEKLGNL